MDTNGTIQQLADHITRNKFLIGLNTFFMVVIIASIAVGVYEGLPSKVGKRCRKIAFIAVIGQAIVLLIQILMPLFK